MMRRLLGALVMAVLAGVIWLAAWLHLAHDWHPLIALAAAVSVPVLFDAVVLGFQFISGAWFRRGGGPDSRYPMSASIRAWAGEIAASLRTFFYAQIRHHDWEIASTADGSRASAAHASRIPVLLVHGYFCNRGIWYPFARWLAARGHPVDSVNLEPIFGSIDNYPPIVAQGVRRLQERSGAPQVAIVAHSMGGLVVRAYLARYGSGSVCSAVTLGSPHHGTWIANFGIGHNVAQMRPDSTWLRDLEAREADNAGAARAPFTTIVTAHDNIVMPLALQALGGASMRSIAARGHVALAYDRSVWELAADAIDAACARPGAGDDHGRSAHAAASPALRSGSPA